jgi:hypothetical protein
MMPDLPMPVTTTRPRQLETDRRRDQLSSSVRQVPDGLGLDFEDPPGELRVAGPSSAIARSWR